MFSKEHTEAGHSAFQDAIIDKFADTGKFTIEAVPVPPIGMITVLSDGERGCSLLITDSEGMEDLCKKMNDFFAAAHMFYFGTAFDESGE